MLFLTFAVVAVEEFRRAKKNRLGEGNTLSAVGAWDGPVKSWEGLP